MKLCTNTLASITICLGAIALMTGSNMAAAQTPKPKPGELKVIAVEQLNDDDRAKAISGTFEVRVENGKVTAKRDGKAIPLDQIRQEDGRITILDQHGQPLDVIIADPGTFSFDWNAGEGRGLGRFFAGAGQPEGPAPKVMLGVQMSEPGPALNKHLRLEEGKTTMISGVYEGLPAHDAGLEEFDIITEVDGKGPADNATIREILAEKNPGDSVTFTVIHEGRAKDVKVKLDDYDAQKMAEAKLLGSGAHAQVWTRFGGGDFKHFMPQWQGDNVFVVPPGEHWEKHWEHIGPQIQDLLKQHQQPAAPLGDKGVEERLERLDKRLADLEKLLEKLAEQRGTR